VEPFAPAPEIDPLGSLAADPPAVDPPLWAALTLPVVELAVELDFPGFACATTPARIPAAAKLPTASHRRRRQSRPSAASRAAAGDAGPSRRLPSMARSWPTNLTAVSEDG